jgi:hypothetical protein
VPDARSLREKATHCRNMAKIAIDGEVRDQLLAYAEEFEAEAAKLDLATAGNKPRPADLR